MPRPTISVVIPAHNCAQYIEQALDSIYAQICRPDQVIVVDDGSTDHISEAVQTYCFTEERLQSYLYAVAGLLPGFVENDYLPENRSIDLMFLRQINRGPSAARNFGLQHSRGQWIAFLDADDLWLPSTCRVLLDLMDNYPQSAFLFGNGLNFSESAASTTRVSDILGGFTKGPIPQAFKFILKQNPILTGAVLIDAQLIHKAGGFREDISHGEDHDLWLKLALFTQPACTDDVVLLRRRRGSALSTDQEAFYRTRPRIFRDIKRAYEAVLMQKGIDMEKSIIAAQCNLAYFYYLHKMPLKATTTAIRCAWTSLADKFANIRKPSVR